MYSDGRGSGGIQDDGDGSSSGRRSGRNLDLTVADLGRRSRGAAMFGGERNRRWWVDHIVGDAELGGVLILSSATDDDLDTVMGDIGFETGGGSPDEFSGVRDVVYNTSYRLNICRRATEKDDRDGAFGCRL